MTRQVFLSLGSNLGDRAGNLRAALSALRREMVVTRVSSLWDTKPVGEVAQPDFLNLVVEGRTDLAPTALLSTVKRIERAVGRRPTYRWGPRVLDIDIVLYGDLVVDLPELVIPHPAMVERAFVLAPLAEIAPRAIEPRSGETVQALLHRVQGRDDVRRLGRPDTVFGTQGDRSG